ncbi:hypothetical protein ACNAN0_07840 [Agrilactobacillus fermenti]|uniref:hypothetical protein n=1 Tax=Agrilactobacillus fermenti TaxID=2586909 RepID=UPI003A5BC9A6
MLTNIGETIIDLKLQQQLNYASLSIKKNIQFVQFTEAKAALPEIAKIKALVHENYSHLGHQDTQLLLETDFFTDEAKTMAQLKALDDVIDRQLAQDVYQWPLSYLPQDFGQSANHNTPFEASQTAVRFALPEILLRSLYGRLGSEYDSYRAFKDACYLHIAKNMVAELATLTYFFAATPIFDQANSRLKRSAFQAELYLDGALFNSLTNYRQAIRQAAKLAQPKLLNSPIFLRPAAGDPEFKQGIQFIELRGLDLQPNVVDGIFEYQLQLVKIALLNAFVSPEATTVHIQTKLKHWRALVGEDPLVASAYQDDLVNAISSLSYFNDKYLKNHGYQNLLTRLIATARQNNQLQAYQVAQSYSNIGALAFGKTVAQKNKRITRNNGFSLRGYSEKTLSVQHLLSSVLKFGVHYHFLNDMTDMLALRLGHHLEYVAQGQKTSQNSATLAALLADPIALNQTLASVVAIPKRIVTDSWTQAQQQFKRRFANNGLIIQPLHQADNQFGEHFFAEPISERRFKQAYLEAEDVDAHVMVTAYVPGSIYDFYICDGQVQAVIEKVPGNVIGDGISTIAELIMQKNDHADRGRWEQTPFVTLQATAEVKAMLTRQNMTLDTIPERGVQVLLSQQTGRHYGGETMIVTAEIDTSYLKLVEKVAAHIQLRHGTMKLVIDNIYAPYQARSQNAILLAASSTPNLIAFDYPARGKAAQLSDQLIQTLFKSELLLEKSHDNTR